MINNKKLQVTLQNKTNRDLFFLTKEFIKNEDLDISDNVIYQVLIEANLIQNYNELVLNFDKIPAKPLYFLKIMNKIISGIPLQYALGYTYFDGNKFYCNKETLIPRAETEDLVFKIKKYIKNFNLESGTIVDCCAGTGCIGISLGKTYGNFKIYCIEKYKSTINVLQKNIDANEVNVEVIKGNSIYPLINNNIKCDIFISNPPYVDRTEEIESNVKANEPLRAIYVKEGTFFYEEFFKYHDKFLKDKWLIAFEIGYDQEEKLKSLINKYFKESVKYKFEKDMYQLTRYLFITNVDEIIS